MAQGGLVRDSRREFKAEAEVIVGLLVPASDNLRLGQRIQGGVALDAIEVAGVLFKLVMPRRTHFGCDHWGSPI